MLHNSGSHWRLSALRPQAVLAEASADVSNGLLVPLHRGFDDLVGAGPQRWQAFWLDEQFDAAGDAGSASDKAGTLES